MGPDIGDASGYIGRRRGRSGLAMSFVDGAAVIGGAARLWWRHWPVLFGLWLLGAAAAKWLLHLGVVIGRHNGTAGYLVFLLSPLAVMISMALMLIVVRSSLPRLRGSGRPTAGGLLRHLTSLLVPFLAVYASLGLLRDDVSEYLYAIFSDEVLSNAAVFTDPKSVDVTSRFPFTVRLTLVVAILVVLVLRWVLPRWDRARGWVFFGLIMGYVELLWLSQLAKYVSPNNEWWRQRQVLVWIADGWTRLAQAAGPLDDAVLWVGDQLGKADVVLLAPLSWLLLGAVVYRREIQMSLEVAEDAPPPRWLNELPGPMRWLGGGIHLDLRNRFGPLANGIRLMARVGLIPTLFFCLIFTVARLTSRLAWELERLVIGAQDLASFWWPASYPLGVINQAIAMVAMTCVLAASVDRILLAGQRANDDAPRSPAVPMPAMIGQPGAVNHA